MNAAVEDEGFASHRERNGKAQRSTRGSIPGIVKRRCAFSDLLSAAPIPYDPQKKKSNS